MPADPERAEPARADPERADETRDAYLGPQEVAPRDVDDLVRLLDLEELDRDLFRADNPGLRFREHLYGGQVAAQAVRAAVMTVPGDRRVHSMHGYFLRPGSAERPTILHVDRDRDGRSFTARRVVARQGGDAIFTMLASFHVDEHGPEWDAEPGAPAVAPEELPESPLVGHNSMFDMRDLGPGHHQSFPGLTHRFWAKARGMLPDDDVVHTCVLTYLSDMFTGFAKLPPTAPRMGGPSLDHAVWYHRQVHMDDWVLVDLEPIVATGARGFYTGTVHDRGGRLVASITQEHLARAQPPA